MDDGRVTLRSYRLAFELERRIHRVDRFRIPVPYGVRLVLLGWWAAFAVLVLLATGLPILGSLLTLLPGPVRLVLLPVAAAHAVCRPTSDARPLYEALAARMLAAFQRKQLRLDGGQMSTGIAWLSNLAVVPDERGCDYRQGVVRGPAVVLLRLPARVTCRRSEIELEQTGESPLFRGRELRLTAGQRLVLR